MPQERGVVIRMDLELEANLPGIMGAEHEIRDALTNLVLNAVDAMPEGGAITLCSRLAPVAPRAARRQNTSVPIQIEVRDTGVGMSEKTRNLCLEPFFTTKGERGTGLGLAMVYGMAQRHSAELEIESELGTGTTMRLTFPSAASPAAPGIAAEEPALLRPLRILFIDDDPLLRRSVAAVLTGDGHAVTLAEGGQAGIDAFAAAQRGPEPFAAVLTDLGMPFVDGRTVAAAIKSLSPATPVLLLTGWGARMLEDDEIPAHIDRVLSKPPKLSELRAALAELTRPRPPSRSSQARDANP
jgi:CheY-like chemotaxis protein/anti-sigma regulatory factor (Ser/Thr protein kinase)